MTDRATRFQDHLSRRGLRLTPERRAILNAAESFPRHFTAEELVRKLYRGRAPVSRPTVYRAIPLLLEARVLRQVAFTDRHAHFELFRPDCHHEHLICLGCGKIIEFFRPILENELLAACRRHRFHPRGHKVEITGYCRGCREKGKAATK
jgi:Fur family ferric uptake transcriptional regulator